MLSIIGCGNPVRSDDGVGHYVIQALRADSSLAARQDLGLFDAGTDGMAVMYQARGSDALILVDACSTGAEPGAVFEVPGDEFDDLPPKDQNSHAFRWDHALYAGRRIYQDDFPLDVTVFLVEAQSLAPGLELSDVVMRSAGQVISRIRQKIAGQPAAGADSLELRQGSLYLDAVLRERYFGQVECVAAIPEAGRLYLAPLRNAAGGHLLKQRNSQGDCIVQLQAFFRDQAWDDTVESLCAVQWDQDRAALSIELPAQIEKSDAVHAL